MRSQRRIITRSHSSKDDIRERFGAHAAAYATSLVHAAGASLGRLVELVQPRAHWRALDVATGAGHTALAFAPHVAAVIATDITPQMLAETEALASARGAANVTTQIADAEALPFPDRSFELVTCRIAPHHFGDVAAFVRECGRVLTPGGTLAVVDNVGPDDDAAADWVDALERIRDHTHNRCLSMAEWMAVCARAGLTVVHTEMLAKRIGLLEWAQRVHAPAQTVARLRAMLVDAPEPVRPWLQPVSEGNDTDFTLWEGIVIARVTDEQREGDV